MAFTGKVVLITGASAGIGAAAARQFAQLGASLALVARNADNLQKVADECRALHPKADDAAAAAPLIIAADVSKDAERIVATTISHFGRLNVLVNNAGIGGYGPLSMATADALDQFDSVMLTNVRAVFQLILFARPHLIAAKGNIVNVSSVVGLRAFAGVSVYCMSKAALDQLTRCVSLELAGDGVRCNSVNPGVIATAFQRNAGLDAAAYAAFAEASKGTHPLGRIGEADEVAAAIVFLADDQRASFVTGTLLPVDGGKANMCPR